MSVDTLDTTYYYDYFERGGGLNWDLGLMLSALDRMDVTQNGTFDTLREQPSAQLLLLGSATAQNLDNMALLDKRLRPGLGDQDKVFVIDYNLYPLQKHQQRIGFIAQAEESFKRNNPDTDNPLLYPSFEVAQADMKRLPFADGSLDVAVSDYTLNFAQDREEVDQTFSEIARVLSADGFLFMSVRGNPDFPYRPGDELTPGHNEVAQKELAGSVSINLLPLATYLGIAEAHGLQLVADSNATSHSEILCGVFQKVAPTQPAEGS